MQRFFVPREALSRGTVAFGPEQSRQIATVLRLHPGDDLNVLDNAGWIYDVHLTDVSTMNTIGVVRGRHLASGEPRTKLTLYLSLLKADKLEFVLQKGTELGVSGFVPVISDRSIIGAIISENRRTRWERIIAEAAEQCERGRLPQLSPAIVFPQACEQVHGLSFIAVERGDRPSLQKVLTEKVGNAVGSRPFSLNLFIGPEGGYSPEESNLAVSYGIIPVNLGPRILRAETAAIVGATLVLAYTGDLE
ncbi:MAG TPA: RsmE family RNA methyltransferase [Chloroflexota bacterium]|nr:RsmE family RNA methyltransferase [Chloroflexota bacterium]